MVARTLIDIHAPICEIRRMDQHDFAGEEEECEEPEPERPHRLQFVGIARLASELYGPPIGGLPADFIAARDLLASEGDSAMARAVALVAKYFGGYFDADNVDWKLSEFLGLRYSEHDAIRVELARIEFFDDERLPAASGVAWFELPTQFERSVEEMEAWEAENSYLDHGVSFLWKLDGEHAKTYELRDTLELRREYFIDSLALEDLATSDEEDDGTETDDEAEVDDEAEGDDGVEPRSEGEIG